jgi:hypothetical protein
MKCATTQIALGVVLAVAGSIAQTARAQTNETWGGQGGVSSWQARAPKATGASAGRIATGGESSWGAGKGSAAAGGARGGVWSDGTSLHAAAVQAPGAKAAAGVGSLVKPVGLATLGEFPSRSHMAMTSSKGQATGRPGGFHAATGAKGPSGPQFGPSKVGGMSRRTSRGRSGATSRHGQFGGSGSGAASGQGLGSPMQSDPAMKELNGGESNSTLSLEPQSSLDSSSH